TKKVTSRRNNSATCPDFFSNQMKEKDFFLFVVFVFSGRFWLFSSFVYCTVYCKNGL
ncbi:terminase large subunit, partial [Escherichia coli]|nr:terminase large subunit [Escherichia coli]